PRPDLIGGKGDYRYPGFAAHLYELDAAHPATDVASLAGPPSLRVGGTHELDRPATARQVEAMRARLGAARVAAAIGLSTGLAYAPAAAAPTGEVIALAELLHAAGGIHATQMRDESDHVLDSLDETFGIGRAVDVPVVV